MSSDVTVTHLSYLAQKKPSSPNFWFEECLKFTKLYQHEAQMNIKLSYEIELLKAKLYVQQALSV